MVKYTKDEYDLHLKVFNPNNPNSPNSSNSPNSLDLFIKTLERGTQYAYFYGISEEDKRSPAPFRRS